MSITEQVSEKLLTSIKNGEAPFRVIPQEIGELKFVYSNNTKAEPYTKGVKRKKLFLWIGAPVTVALVCWLIINNSPIFNSIVSAIAIIVIVKSINNILNFKGTDFFVGSNGFAVLKFKNSRDNIVSKSIYIYSDFSELITGETVKKQNGAYVGTDYYFCFFGIPDSNNQVKLIIEEGGTHHQEKSKDDPHSPHYTFWKKIEEIWTAQKLEQLLVDKHETVTFSILHTKKNDDRWFATPYITILPNCIVVGDREYNRETLKNLWFENGNLVIEHVNHLKKFFGLIEKGNIEHIPMANVGNRKLFILYLSSIIKF